MYAINVREYGFELTFEGFIKAEEMEAWLIESQTVLMHAPEKFGVLIDMRTLKPLPDDAQAHVHTGQKHYRKKGMDRSAVVVAHPVTKMQFQRIARETGIYEWERYFDASSQDDWEQAAMNWILDQVDPDL
ncbi:MAG: hypothetical protein GY906_07875 [bacterium]|nr:hypothetical protein [bacterium]